MSTHIAQSSSSTPPVAEEGSVCFGIRCFNYVILINMFVCILKDSCYYMVTSRPYSWAGPVMRALWNLGYPIRLIIIKRHRIDLEVLNVSSNDTRAGRGKNTYFPTPYPIIGIQRCAYVRWFVCLPKSAIMYVPEYTAKSDLYSNLGWVHRIEQSLQVAGLVCLVMNFTMTCPPPPHTHTARARRHTHTRACASGEN